MSTLRKAIFLIFVIIYLIVAPLTVLYALGYIFNPVQQTLMQTGLVSLNSNPSRANVSIDGRPLKEKTPLVLRDLKPGVYKIQIDLPGRHPWQEQVVVRPERALRFEEILLFPVSLEPHFLGNFPVSKITSVPGGRYFLVQEDNQAPNLYLFDPEEIELRPVFFQSVDGQEKVSDIYMNSVGDRAVIFLQKEGGIQPVFAKFSDLSQNVNLTDFLAAPFRDLKWSLNRKNLLFYLRENTLFSLDLDRGILYPILSKRVRDYLPSERGLFVLNEKGQLFRLSEKGKILDILLSDPAKSTRLFGTDPTEPYTICVLPNPSVFSTLNDSLMIFLSKKGKLLCNRLPYFLDEEVEEVAPAVSHPRFAYQKNKEIWGVDFERELEKVFFEAGPTPRKIYRGEGKISRLTWFYHDRYLLFLENNRLMVLDFEGEGGPIELLKVSSHVPDFFLDAKRGFLYYADPEEDRLVRVKLFEESSLIPRFVETS